MLGRNFVSTADIIILVIIWHAGAASVLTSCVCLYLFSSGVSSLQGQTRTKRFDNEFLAPNEQEDLEMEM